MLNSAKFLLLVVSVGLVFVNCQTAEAQLVTYEMGPFHVGGGGLTPAEAQADAYGKMYDMLVDIENNLPEGDVLLEFVIEDEDWESDTRYFIDFHVVIGTMNPPAPPSGI